MATEAVRKHGLDELGNIFDRFATNCTVQKCWLDCARNSRHPPHPPPPGSGGGGVVKAVGGSRRPSVGREGMEGVVFVEEVFCFLADG